ncbi:hypothetical protein PR001_g5665 [Phytophthora rubi]|uniref:Uncharacterized protein n=1 Tax=Phytophthora rubi TaxID=129364 RepID=A0A6A3NRA0_9STRA|nr:hypothetical protein PR001_g5665 [Phytophthora rubi]
MSCSLIEAKFQVLDRTIKMMSKSKSLRTPRVASSEQLREIVETQKPTALLPTLKPIRGAVVTRSQQSHVNPRKTSRSQPNTSRDEKSERPDKWVDPKQQRTEQLLQDTWHVDEDNFLLFDASQTANFPVPSRYFNPFVYFPGLRQPSDLYGHVLRIMVTSIKPVTRIVINTSVQFTRTPDEAVVEPSADSIRKHSETVASQEASLLKVLTRRNSSTTSIARRRRKKTPKGKPRVKQLKPDLESYHDASTASLAMDQCSPWSARDQDDPNSTDTPTSSMLEQMFKLQLEESRSLSPNASPRNGPTAENLGKSPRLPMTTIDKKKMQLQHMRASMRREMLREEQIDGNM